MRVLTAGNLFPPAAQGGYERLWVAGLHALRGAGHEVAVLTTRPVPGAEVAPGADAAWPWPVARELRWWWRDFGWPRPRPLQARAVERHNARVLARRLAGADVLVTWNLGGMGLSLLEHARRAGVPVVGVVGDLWPVYGPRVDPAWRRRPRDLRPLGHWIAISAWVRERSGLGDEVAHPGVDLPAAVEGAGPPRRLLVTGRLERAKGADVAVRALAGLPDASLVLDGPADPAHRTRLRAIAAEEAVSDRVRFARSVPEAVGAAYAAADAVLFCVRWAEPWGLVPLEAMAAGRPVVATATGGAAEYLRDGENCLVVPPGDVPAVVGAVRALEDPGLRARLVAGGRATAARFPRTAFDAALVAAVERIGATRARRPSAC